MSDNCVVELSPTSGVPVASFFCLVLGLDGVSLEGVSLEGVSLEGVFLEEASLEEDWAVVTLVEVVVDTTVNAVILVLLVLLLDFAVAAKVLLLSDCTRKRSVLYTQIWGLIMETTIDLW